MALDGARVVSTRFPYLPLRVELRGTSELLECLLDTGFDGDVIVPAGVALNWREPDAQLTWALADDSQVVAPAYVGTARVGTMGPFPIVISVLGDEPIVGRHLTDRFSILLDHGQRLIVEP